MSVRTLFRKVLLCVVIAPGFLVLPGCHSDNSGDMHMELSGSMSKDDLLKKGDELIGKGQAMKEKGMQMNNEKMTMAGQNMMAQGQMMKDMAMKR